MKIKNMNKIYDFLEQFYHRFTTNKKSWEIEKAKGNREKLMELVKCKVGGFRAVMKEGLNGINPIVVNILATAIAKNNKSIVIGYDHRNNSKLYASIITQVCLKNNMNVVIYEHPVTPYLAFESRNYDVGIMITASHNPKEYNGIKVYKNGRQARNSEIVIINEQIQSMMEEAAENNNYELFYTPLPSMNNEEDFTASYTKSIDYESFFSMFYVNPSNNPRIFDVFFCGVNGVSTDFINQASERFQMNFNTSSKLNRIDPNFSEIKFPNPEVDKNWETFANDVGYHNNGVYFMCDGDGDRFGMRIFKNEKWYVFSPNEIARIFLWYFLRLKQNNNLVLINTFLCDESFSYIAEKLNIRHETTQTGSKYIIEAADRLKTSPRDMVLGYEDPMGYIIGALGEKDGIQSSVLMYSILQEQDPFVILNEMEIKFGTYYSHTTHCRVYNPEELLNNAINLYSEINSGIKPKAVYDAFQIFEDNYFLYLRISSTESMVKVYGFSKLFSNEELKFKLSTWIKKYFQIE